MLWYSKLNLVNCSGHERTLGGAGGAVVFVEFAAVTVMEEEVDTDEVLPIDELEWLFVKLLLDWDTVEAFDEDLLSFRSLPTCKARFTELMNL